MLRLLSAALFVAVASLSAPSMAQPGKGCTLDPAVEVFEGFTTGRDLVAYSADQLRIYLRAFVDGLTVAPLLDAPASCIETAFSCLAGLTEDDMLIVLKTYIDSHPDELDDGANLIGFRALLGTCMFRADVPA